MFKEDFSTVACELRCTEHVFFCKDNGKDKENTVRFDRYTMELSLQPNDCTLYISWSPTPVFAPSSENPNNTAGTRRQPLILPLFTFNHPTVLSCGPMEPKPPISRPISRRIARSADMTWSLAESLKLRALYRGVAVDRAAARRHGAAWITLGFLLLDHTTPAVGCHCSIFYDSTSEFWIKWSAHLGRKRTRKIRLRWRGRKNVYTLI
jgi:hypothetical protein